MTLAIVAAALAALTLLGFYSAARADVISFNPGTDFSTTPATISFGSPAAASFTLTYLGSNPNDITFTVDGVSTGGNGAVNTSSFPGPGQQPIPAAVFGRARRPRLYRGEATHLIAQGLRHRLSWSDWKSQGGIAQRISPSPQAAECAAQAPGRLFRPALICNPHQFFPRPHPNPPLPRSEL
ncbi:MAG: hypothetical protein ACREE4_07160 [Stellaceae bacterium]